MMKVTRAKGSFLTFEDGRRVLDAGSGAVCVNLGYGNPIIIDAVRTAMEQASYVHSQYKSKELLELEAILARWVPDGMIVYHFTATGSAGIDHALRLAGAYQRIKGASARRSIISLAVSYHGSSLASQSICGARQYIGPITFDLHNVVQLPVTGRMAATEAALCQQLLSQIDPRDVAAIVVEPVNGTSGGVLRYPPDLLRNLREFARQNDIVFIADEVLTGFHRCGPTFASQVQALEPDILVSGKGLTAGFGALCAVLVSEQMAEVLRGVAGDVITSTAVAQPPACAAAIAVLRILEEEVAGELPDRIEFMDAVLARLGKESSVADVRGIGMLRAVEFKTPEGFAPAERRALLYEVGLDFGVRFYEAARQQDICTLIVAPPLNASPLEIELVGDALLKLARVG